MRFNTDFKLFSLFLSLSIAAPFAQYSEDASAGNQIDNGIDSPSNNLFTGTSGMGIGAADTLLMAARRQRDKNRRFRPHAQPQLTPPFPQEDECLVDSTGSRCQPKERPDNIPTQEPAEIPDPWLEEPEDVDWAAGRALGLWGLWNLLNNPDPSISP